MNIGFIGFGEAGYELAAGLKREGLKELMAYDQLINDDEAAQKVGDRAKLINVSLEKNPKKIFEEARIIFVAVPAQFALEVCNEMKDFIHKQVTYIDVSASSPNVKEEISRVVLTQKGSFVDAAMLGPLTVHQHKVPILASGDGAKSFMKQMNSYGMNIQYISDLPGDASSIKLLRSIYMKGTAALLVELLQASRKMGLEAPVIHSLKESIENSPFDKTITQLITGTSIHAARRAYELESSLKMLKKLEVDSEMTASTKNKLELVANLNIQDEWGGIRPENWQTVIDKLNDAKRGEHI